MDKFHTIKGYVNLRTVYINNVELLPFASQAIINHSPDGFMWGYGGSGTAQLAAAIMLELTGSISGYQALKWKRIANLPKDQDFEFEISDKELLEIAKENPTLKRRN